MSDVTVAPAATPAASTPAAAPTPAAPQHEVQINQNPTGTPNPVPPQAPPAEDKPRPETRREGLQRAFNKHRTEHPVAPPREAKKGDNAPPEDTPDDFTLKKRPGEQAAKIDQPRDRGRFAPKATPDGQAQPNVGAQAGQQAARPGTQAAPQPYVPPPGAPAHHHPLPRMCPRAAAAWDKVPDEVRADAHRMYREVDQAFRKYKGAHDYMQTIAPYVKMAQRAGHLARQGARQPRGDRGQAARRPDRRLRGDHPQSQFADPGRAEADLPRSRLARAQPDPRAAAADRSSATRRRRRACSSRRCGASSRPLSTRYGGCSMRPTSRRRAALLISTLTSDPASMNWET